MTWAFAIFMLASLVAVISPGPAFLALSHAAVNRPRTEALLFGLGLATIAVFWCALALFGLTAIFVYVPWLYTVLKLAGGCYLLYLAIHLWRGAREDLPVTHVAPQRGYRAFFSACIINLTNPKAVLFAGSVLLAIFPADITILHKILILLTLFCIEMSLYGMLVFWLSQPVVRQTYHRLKRWIDRTAGVVLGSLGLKFLMSRG
ncbi:MAG: LysE family transporter [Rhodobacteraceae bacterium]|nr:LysE family transporter [Paracoccaceae bacterium]